MPLNWAAELGYLTNHEPNMITDVCIYVEEQISTLYNLNF